MKIWYVELTLLEITIPTWINTTFQEITTLNMNTCILFYDTCMAVLTRVFIFTLSSLILITTNNFINLKFTKNHVLELVWSITPVALLLIIAAPSINTLYTNRQESTHIFTPIKIIGSQWQWNYQIDSLTKPAPVLVNDSNQQKSFLSDSISKVAPIIINSKILKIQVTREDVIHSWFLPRAGIKIDAIPGKIIEQNIIFKRQGYIFGNCAEVCGPFHRIIPIKILVNRR